MDLWCVVLLILLEEPTKLPTVLALSVNRGNEISMQTFISGQIHYLLPLLVSMVKDG